MQRHPRRSKVDPGQRCGRDDWNAMSNSRALVLFSGGQDSTVALAWALERFAAVETVGFDYGQRHRIELEARLTIRDKLPALDETYAERLGPDHLLDLTTLGRISDTALTSESEIAFAENGLPTTFVPGRNLIFLSFAAALAYRRDCRHIVLGVCETDYSGYPDCRDDTIKAMQVALGLGLDRRLVLDLVVEDSHSCYLGDRSRRHAWGYGCGHCPACDLRSRGFAAYQTAPDDSGPSYDD